MKFWNSMGSRWLDWHIRMLYRSSRWLFVIPLQPNAQASRQRNQAPKITLLPTNLHILMVGSFAWGTLLTPILAQCPRPHSGNHSVVRTVVRGHINYLRFIALFQNVLCVSVTICFKFGRQSLKDIFWVSDYLVQDCLFGIYMYIWWKQLQDLGCLSFVPQRTSVRFLSLELRAMLLAKLNWKPLKLSPRSL